MQIYISEEAIIADIQDKFHGLYPCLKLEFFHTPYVDRVCNAKRNRVPPEMPIEKIRILHSFGWLDISHYRTALAVEHDLSYLFGLSAKVLHRSGSIWLQTTRAGHLSLEELNAGDGLKEPAALQLPEEPEKE
ncbi:hypothetical protein [Chitinophaga flava]|nr:hypothetical protein [Chitinophaga flava]